MPWTSKDAPKKVKGKNRAKWASIANAIYRDCMKKGSDKECAAKAKRVANSKFSEGGLTMKTEKMPKRALTFMDHECEPIAVHFADGDDKPPKLKLIGYSGGIIKNHWYWDDLAIDLTGIQFSAKTPILEEHWLDRKIAFTGKPMTENGKLETDPEKTQFVDTEESLKFQTLSKAGFPYQASLYAKPSIVERISEGEKAKVNGFTMKGPGTIWRKCALKEISVCVFGYDSNTKATAFADNEEIELSFEQVNKTDKDIKTSTGKEVKNMPFDVKKFKEDNPDGYKALAEEIKGEITTDLTAQFSTEKAGLVTENESLKTQLAAKDTENTALTERVLGLEKNDAIRAENELTATAEHIWAMKLAESDVPESLHGKCSAMVSHAKFTKDGVLDTDKFAEAIEVEIKDWEAKGARTSVLGTGFSSKDEVDSETKKKEALTEENQKLSDRMLAQAGQPQKKAA